jgi:chromatin modification-related protein VID21
MGGVTVLPGSSAEGRKRAADYLWSINEDMLLKSLTDRYPGNWQLICDSFNSTRLAASADKRTPWDCVERWRLKWGPSHPPHTPSDMTPHQESAPEATPMTTRKRLASISQAQRPVIASTNASNGETKKRRRRNLMYDTIRKASKKREAAHKASG